MWNVAECCWKEDPKNRWTAVHLSERLQFLLRVRSTTHIDQTEEPQARAARARRHSISGPSTYPSSPAKLPPSPPHRRHRSSSTADLSALQSQQQRDTVRPPVELDPGISPTFDSLATPGMTMDWTTQSTYDTLMETGLLSQAYPASTVPPSSSGVSQPSSSTDQKLLPSVHGAVEVSRKRDYSPEDYLSDDRDEPRIPGSFD